MTLPKNSAARRRPYTFDNLLFTKKSSSVKIGAVLGLSGFFDAPVDVDADVDVDAHVDVDVTVKCILYCNV